MDKILIVEEDTGVRDAYKRQLGDRVQALYAEDLDAASDLFSANRDIVLITVSGRPPAKDKEMHAEDFIRRVRKTFSGPIVTTSFFADRRRAAREAGADHHAEKGALPTKIFELLKIEL